MKKQATNYILRFIKVLVERIIIGGNELKIISMEIMFFLSGPQINIHLS